jgi:hypothetical protein
MMARVFQGGIDVNEDWAARFRTRLLLPALRNVPQMERLGSQVFRRLRRIPIAE